MIKKYIMILLLSSLSFSVLAERKALLIGNKDYKSSPLNNPVNDVNAIAEKLKDLKFTKIISKYNLNRQEMRKTIRDFRDDLTTGDLALVYYSGHGVQVKGQNFLIPINNDIKDEFDISDGGVSLDFLLNNLTNSSSQANIVILDACRDNPFKQQFKSSTKGLARVGEQLGTIVAFSASTGQVSDDGKDKNGIYTEYLLRHIATKKISINEMFMRVRKDVAKKTHKKQVPIEESGLTEPIYLAGKTEGISLSSSIEGRSQEKASIAPINDNCHSHPSALGLAKSTSHCHPNPNGVHKYSIAQDLPEANSRSHYSVEKTYKRPYIDDINGTVTDMETGLMWQKCSYGQSPIDCSGKPLLLTFFEARSKASQSSFAGKNDWRLPSIAELETLVHCSNGKPRSLKTNGCGNSFITPTIKKAIFINTLDFPYWSSTTYGSNVQIVSFRYGYTVSSTKNQKWPLRLVRNNY